MDNDTVGVINHCGHVFKYLPLKRWLYRNQTCPNCRYNILSNSDLIEYTNPRTNENMFLYRDEFRYFLAYNITNTIFSNLDSSNNRFSISLATNSNR